MVLQVRVQYYTLSVAALVIQGTLQHYTMLLQWFYRGDYNTTQCCSSGFTGETTMLHTQCYGSGFTGETTTLHNVATVVYTEGRPQDYNTTQCYSNGSHTFAAVVCR